MTQKLVDGNNVNLKNLRFKMTKVVFSWLSSVTCHFELRQELKQFLPRETTLEQWWCAPWDRSRTTLTVDRPATSDERRKRRSVRRRVGTSCVSAKSSFRVSRPRTSIGIWTKTIQKMSNGRDLMVDLIHWDFETIRILSKGELLHLLKSNTI